MSTAALRRFDAYGALVRIGFIVPLAFRLFPFMMVISYPILMAGNYYLYRAIYAARGEAPIAGLTADQAITYLLVAWTVRSFYKNPIGRMIGERVKSGEIAVDMIKPIGFFPLWLYQGFGRALHRLTLISIPLVLLVSLTGAVPMPKEPITWGLFGIAVILGFLLSYVMSYLTGLMAFFFEYNHGTEWMMDLLQKLLGGLMVPLSFFPAAVVPWLEKLPFAGMYYQPALIFMEKTTPTAAVGILALQLAWVIAMWFGGALVFHLGRRKLLLQGG